MQLKTKNFGEIDYEPTSVIVFEEGLPAFEHLTRFILLADSPEDLFQWLQSTEDEDLAFTLMDVGQIKPDYKPRIAPDALADIDDGTPMLYYNIAVVPEDLEKMRVNLRAPIVINKSLRRGKQVVANNEEYGLRHYIFDEIRPNGQVVEC